MIYRIDKGFRIKSAHYNLINQVKCPGMYDECLCLGFKNKGEVKVEVEDKVEVDVSDNGNVNTNDNSDDNDNDNVNANDKDNVNQGTVGVRGMPTCLEDQGQNPLANANANVKINDKANQGTCLADFNVNQGFNLPDDSDDDDINKYINLFDKKHLRVKLPAHSSHTNNNSISETASRIRESVWGRVTIVSPTKGGVPLQINVNDSLQTWLDDDNIIVNASFLKNFRCVKSGPSECGKIFLLKNVFISSIHFDRLYIIGPSGNQYNDLKYEDVVFIELIKELPPPDKLPENS